MDFVYVHVQSFKLMCHGHGPMVDISISTISPWILLHLLLVCSGVNDLLTPTCWCRRCQKMASTPAVVDGKCQEHWKRRQQARLRRLVVDENAQQHRPYNPTLRRFGPNRVAADME